MDAEELQSRLVGSLWLVDGAATGMCSHGLPLRKEGDDLGLTQQTSPLRGTPNGTQPTEGDPLRCGRVADSSPVIGLPRTFARSGLQQQQQQPPPPSVLSQEVDVDLELPNENDEQVFVGNRLINGQARRGNLVDGSEGVAGKAMLTSKKTTRPVQASPPMRGLNRKGTRKLLRKHPMIDDIAEVDGEASEDEADESRNTEDDRFMASQDSGEVQWGLGCPYPPGMSQDSDDALRAVLGGGPGKILPRRNTRLNSGKGPRG
eukprot:TRINITY_DN21123_c0_g1_i2.p1 TRINITY_DN21123_c0_g1~~TRINITY_DN21123_c0_g1_i2.p1  ORF type:complete len:261 (+),score=37.77 TRINITY_DN21123_c0_g1_i2:1337-2119(+)